MDQQFVNASSIGKNFGGRRVACFVVMPFENRIYRPLAASFDNCLVTDDMEEIKAWHPDILITATEFCIPWFREYCDDNNVILIGLRHGSVNKYTPPYQEYKLADYVCCSDFDRDYFVNGGVAPRMDFLMTGNPWSDSVFSIPKRESNHERPTILLAPTWDIEVSALEFFGDRFVKMVRDVYPGSRIIIRPHPNVFCNDHPVMEKYRDTFLQWIANLQKMVSENEDVILIEDTEKPITDYFADADILISDGSSLIFEYMVLDRPILLYSSSNAVENGDYADAPGNRWRDIGIEFTTDEEFKSTLAGAFENHKKSCSAKQKQYSEELYGKYQDGKSLERMAQAIKDLPYLEVLLITSENNENVTGFIDEIKGIVANCSVTTVNCPSSERTSVRRAINSFMKQSTADQILVVEYESGKPLQNGSFIPRALRLMQGDPNIAAAGRVRSCPLGEALEMPGLQAPEFTNFCILDKAKILKDGGFSEELNDESAETQMVFRIVDAGWRIESVWNEEPIITFNRGFYEPEDGIRWMSDKGCLYISHSVYGGQEYSDLTFNFTMRCNSPEYYKNFPFAIQVFLNDEPVKLVNFTKSYQSIDVAITLPTKLDSVQTIRFESEESFIPEKLGYNLDPRLLSVNIGDWRIDATSMVVGSAEHDELYSLNAYAKECMEKGKYEDAYRVYARILVLSPDDIDAKVNFGYICKRLGRFDDASALFNSVLAVNPDNLAVQVALTHLKSRMKDGLNDRTAEDAHEADRQYIEAQKLLEDEKVDESIALLEKLLSGSPSHSQANNDLAVLYFEKGDVAKSINHLDLALTLDPNDLVARKNLSDIFIAIGKPDEAIALYKLYLKKNPNDLEALVRLGEIFFREGNVENARSYYTNVFELYSMGLLTHDGTEFIKSKKSNSHVSIIIPVLNNLDYTKKCLDAIEKNTRDISYEIIIVDNGSTDGTTDFLKQIESDAIKCIFNEENAGFVYACNDAAEMATGKYILLLNNDTEVRKDWLPSLVQFADSTPDCGAVGGKQIGTDGRLQEAGGLIFSNGTGCNYGRQEAPNDPKFAYIREVDYCSGAALMVRSKLWKEIGGLDRRYAPAYYEDADLCFEIRKRGYKVYYLPTSEIVHHEGKTAGTNLNSGMKRYQIHNRGKFINKWAKELGHQYPSLSRNIEVASNRLARSATSLYMELIETGDASSICKRVLDGNPVYTDMLVLLGAICKLDGRADDAAIFLSKAIEIASNDTAASILLHELAESVELTTEVKSALESSGAPDMYLEALKLIESGDEIKAVKKLEEVIALNPKHVQALDDLGVLYFKQERMEDALNQLQKAVSVDTAYLPAQRNLADVYTSLARYQDAMRIQENLLANNPKDVESLSAMAYLCEIQGDMDMAGEYCTRAYEAEFGSIKSSSPKSEFSLKSTVPAPKLQTIELTSIDDYRNYLSQTEAALDEMRTYEEELITGDEFTVPGYCYVCRREVEFTVDFRNACTIYGKTIPNWRERMICPVCGLNNRARASIQLFEQLLKPSEESKIYISEQTTPLYNWVARNYRNVVGSEYLGDAVPLGQTDPKGYRNESLTKLSFVDDDFDYLLSFDVFEHIQDYERAFSECARVLKPGGQLLFSIPFNSALEENTILARLKENGEVEVVTRLEYHGDPLHTEGCLSFYQFGWEVLDQLRNKGFEDVKALIYLSKELGNLGRNQIIFTATKAVTSDLQTIDYATVQPSVVQTKISMKKATPELCLKDKADQFLAEGKALEAAQTYNKILAQDPQNMKALVSISCACIILRQFDDALFFQARALEIEPDNTEVQKQIDETRAELINLADSRFAGNTDDSMAVRWVGPVEHKHPVRAPKVSVIVPVKNEMSATCDCLKALITNSIYPDYEVIVVDRASTDGTKQFLAGINQQNVRWVSLAEDPGAVKAVNIGSKLAVGEQIILLPQHTVVAKDWLMPLVRLALTESAAVTPRVIDARECMVEAGYSVIENGSFKGYGEGSKLDIAYLNYACEVESGSRCCILISRASWTKAGGLDEKIDDYGVALLDLALGLRKKGTRVFYQPLSLIKVVEPSTVDSDADGDLMPSEELLGRCSREKVEKELDELLVKPESLPRNSNVLVVEACLPMYDRAAGSHRLFRIIESLLQLGNRVTFISREMSLSEQYVPILQEMGVEVYAGDPAAVAATGKMLMAPEVDLEAILKRNQFNTVILSFWYIAEFYLPLVRKYSPQSTIIVDSVDIHFIRELREAEIKQSVEIKNEALEHKHRELAVYRKADRMWVVTAEEEKLIRELVPGMPVDVVPTIHPTVDAHKSYEETSGLMFVGNFFHTPNADGICHFCRNIFPKVLEKLPNIKLCVIGNSPPASVRALATDNIVVTGYVEDISPYLLNSRVSISPLRYGAGMKGKVGEALSWGLPVVTTSIGAEGMSLVDGEDALVADADEDFADAIVRLYNDQALWEKLSVNGKAKVEREWSPAAIKTRLESVLADAKSTRGQKLLSIVILAHNQLEYTKRCIDSIRLNTTIPYEIVMVDNASTDGTMSYMLDYRDQWLEAAKNADNSSTDRCRDIQFIRNKKNLGYAGGNNAGIDASRGDYVLILNNDTVVTPGWAERLIGCAEQDPTIGIVGPVTNSISGPQLVKRVAYDTDSLAGLESFSNQWALKHSGDSQPFWRIVGFAMLIKRKVIDHIGGLDERYGIGNFEDDDYSIRAAIAGYKSAIAMDCFIHHFGSKTFSNSKVDYKKILHTNWEIFKHKWGLPMHMAYGTPYDVSLLMNREFDSAVHYFSLNKSQPSNAEKLFLAPRWDMPDTWQPVLKEYINSHDPTDGSLLKLYAGSLTGSDSKEVYRRVSAYLSEIGADGDNCPDIEILGTIPEDNNVRIILTGQDIDSRLMGQFPERCLHLNDWLQAA